METMCFLLNSKHLQRSRSFPQPSHGNVGPTSLISWLPTFRSVRREGGSESEGLGNLAKREGIFQNDGSQTRSVSHRYKCLLTAKPASNSVPSSFGSWSYRR